tara:strand:- start:453 stop:884 length:432 start_codon:yes stop_codon:yes gene_type:complete
MIILAILSGFAGGALTNIMSVVLYRLKQESDYLVRLSDVYSEMLDLLHSITNSGFEKIDVQIERKLNLVLCKIVLVDRDPDRVQSLKVIPKIMSSIVLSNSNGAVGDAEVSYVRLLKMQKELLWTVRRDVVLKRPLADLELLV